MAIPEKLRRLMAERDELSKKLDRSLEIVDLWPDAFKTGRVTSWVSGSVSAGFNLTIKRADGETRSFPVQDVSSIILQAHPQFLTDCKSGRYGFKWKRIIEEKEL